MVKDEATKAAELLLGRMKGAGWHIQVWENLGWHYCVINGTLAVYPTSAHTTKYHCLLSSGDYPGSGDGIWTNRRSFDDPNDAVAAQIETAEQVVGRLNAAVQAAKLAAGVWSG